MSVTYCRSGGSSRERRVRPTAQALAAGSGTTGVARQREPGQLTMEELALAGVEGLEPPTPGFGVRGML
jgi:hypothetical protein